MSIGVRIAQLRKAKGLTQAALAEQANLSASAIAMYETNRRTPDRTTLEKLAQALRVNPEELVRPGSESESPSKHGEDAAANQPSSVGQPATKAAVMTTQFALTPEEAKIILFLRMNPMCMPFIESYIRADARQREQLSKAWRLIHDFQGKKPS